jgi:dDENN domain
MLLFGTTNLRLGTVKCVSKRVWGVYTSVRVPILTPRGIDVDCRLTVHHRCLDSVVLPCMSGANFSADRIRAAFLRCFASLLYKYRKHLEPISRRQDSQDGRLYKFKLHNFLKGASREIYPYLEMLSETQAFNEFIMERSTKSPDDAEVSLFDQIVIAKRNRGRHGLFTKQRNPLNLPANPVTPMLTKLPCNFGTRKAVPPNETKLPALWTTPDTPPTKLDPFLMLPPRLAQPPRTKYPLEGGIRRKPVNKSEESIRAAEKR